MIDEADPVPADALAVAVAADLGSLDAELAELTFDSLLDERALTLRDADTDVRSLSFTAGETTIELDIADDAVVGRVNPPVEAALDVVQAGRRRTVRTDGLGRFRAPVDPGPLRLRLDAARRRRRHPVDRPLSSRRHPVDRPLSSRRP